MIVKEYDLINFSVNAEIGARRYYNKVVLCKDGNLIVKIDDVDVPLCEVYHIEIVGNTTDFFNEKHDKSI